MIAWRKVLDDRKLKFRAIIYFSILCLTLFSFLFFLDHNEKRAGYHFNDPILALFDPIDLSSTIFLITYLFSLFGLVIAIRKPVIFLQLIGAYSLMTIIRMLCLYLLPLEPPARIIPLDDIFLHSTFYSGRDNLRDLFFSGHTATLFLFVLVLRGKKLKLLFFTVAVVVGILLMMQHVHFSIDVMAAPFAAWIAVVMEKNVVERYFEAK